MDSRIIANVSLLFGNLPVAARFEAARSAGFDLVESWWPFASAAPTKHEVAAFINAIDAAGVGLVGLNLFAGDMPAGERGVLSHPNRLDEFERSLSATQVIAEATGCRLFNALYGLRQSGVSDEVAQETALVNLGKAASVLPGANLLLEALSTAANGDYALVSLKDADLIRAKAAERNIQNVGLLFDSFHLASNGRDLEMEVRNHAGHLVHVQLADNPGRGAPGTGNIDFLGLLRVLDEVGYSGGIAAEFVPGGRDVNHNVLESSLYPTVGALE